MGDLSLTFAGQVRGGKNNTLITRTGHRYPNPTFAKWRDLMVAAVQAQAGRKLPVFRKPLALEATILYTPEDRRRRDVPALLDAILHVLERAKVVEDDAQVKDVRWTQRPVDKVTAGVTLTLRPRQEEG